MFRIAIYHHLEIIGKDGTKRHQALTDDFAKLYVELEKEGLFKPSYLHVIYRILEAIALFYIALLLIWSPSILRQLSGCFLFALAQGRCGWIQHEAGHNSLTTNPKIDRILQAITTGVGTGVSSSFFSTGHNRHHAMPQRATHDVDLQTLPILAFVSNAPGAKKYARRLWINYQVATFLIIYPLIALFTWRVIASPRHVLRHGLYFQGLCMLGNHVLGYYSGFWAYMLHSWMFSSYFWIMAAMNHTYLPVASESTHWVEYALLHTADIDQRPWCDWWMGFLNYQIEHHFFPTMPQFRHPLIKYRVKALAEKHGLPYHVYSFPEGLRKTLSNLKHVSQELINSN